jgi:sortase A
VVARQHGVPPATRVGRLGHPADVTGAFRSPNRCAKLTAMGGHLRTRLTVIRVAVGMAAIVLVINACGTFETKTAPRTVTAPPQLPVPFQLETAPQLPATTSTIVDLPVPVGIPLESYADEPVVEYGSIEIPKIGLVHQTFEGVTLHNIDHGPSHWPGTATPGETGNAVFAGHRVTNSRPFRRIDELAPGDQVIFRVKGVRSTYTVTNSLVVQPEDTWIADQTPQSTATLYACHPPGSAAYRYVVQLALASTGPDV